MEQAKLGQREWAWEKDRTALGGAPGIAGKGRDSGLGNGEEVHSDAAGSTQAGKTLCR